jgi:Spy/CpxP family protein refolding chaperone
VKKLIAALFALSMAAAPALARPPGGGPDGPPMLNPERIDRLAGELNLPPQTVSRIKERLYAAKKEHVKLRADVESARLELHQMLDQDNPERSAVLRQVEAVGQKEIALQKLKIGALLDVRAMLTPEQRQKLRTLEEEHGRGKKGKRHGRDDDGPDRRGGPDDDRPEE